MKRNASTFGFMGCYTCGCCGRLTRQTGRGDNEYTELCAECYDLAGIENAISDGHYTFEAVRTEVTALLNKIVRLGGKPTSDFAEMVTITATPKTLKPLKPVTVHAIGSYFSKMIGRKVGACVASGIGAQKFSGVTTDDITKVTCARCLKRIAK